MTYTPKINYKGWGRIRINDYARRVCVLILNGYDFKEIIERMNEGNVKVGRHFLNKVSADMRNQNISINPEVARVKRIRHNKKVGDGLRRAKKPENRIYRDALFTPKPRGIDRESIAKRL